MKLIRLLTFFISICYSLPGFSQTNLIDVADNTLKVGGFGEEVFYYGFAEGDQVIFSFEEVKGKELKEIEITELPSASKYMAYKTSKVANKMINIQRTGIYKFRFANSAVGGRICSFKIQRIPASTETQNFNTSVYWRTVYDTSYVPTEERYLLRSDTSFVDVVDQLAKISSQNALNGNPNKTVVDFSLPEGTIKWSYYIGVGTEGKREFDRASEQFLNSASRSVIRIPGYDVLAAMALQSLIYFNKIQGPDNVKYWFITDWNNVLMFKANGSFLQYKQGDIINDFASMSAPNAGKVYLGLLNDNIVDAIEVVVKVSAMVVKNEWAERMIEKMYISSRQEAYLKN